MNLIHDYSHIDKTLLKELEINSDGTISVTRAGYSSPTDAAKDVYAKYLSGTTVYGIPYQSASQVTSYIQKGTAGQILTALENGYEWKDASDLDMSGSNVVQSVLSGINLTTSWTNVDSINSRLSDGSYIIQITYASCIYTGVFSYVATGTVEDEIILHQAGQIDSVGGVNRGRLYAKIGTTSGTGYLKLATTQSESNVNLTIKYKKLI